jgi:hypothetical protein
MKRLAILAAVTLQLGFPAQVKAGPVFGFQFDSATGESDGIVTQPIVGTGTLTLPDDPGNGTFALSSLGALKMSFVFRNTTFTQADIASDLNLSELNISSDGSQRRAYFTDTGDGAGGPNGGSLNLTDGKGDFITFEPSFYGGHNLYIESGPTPNSVFSGNYLGLTLATIVPEPAGLTLALACLIGVALQSGGVGRLRVFARCR